MTEIFRTCITTAEQVEAARAAAAALPGGGSTFTAMASATGHPPATHYFVCGFASPELVAAVTPYCTVSELPALPALASLGLVPMGAPAV